MNEITEIIKSITPGVAGAVSGVVYTRGNWMKRIANFLVFNNRLRAVFLRSKSIVSSY